MSTKTHRPGKGSAVVNPLVRIAVCPSCSRYGLLSTATGRCTGEVVHDMGRGNQRVIDRAKRCQS